MASESLCGFCARVGLWLFMTTLLPDRLHLQPNILSGWLATLNATKGMSREIGTGRGDSGLFIRGATTKLWLLKSVNRRWFFRPRAIRAPNVAGGHDRTMFGEAVLDFDILEGPLDRVDAEGSRWRPFQPCGSIH